VNLYCGTVCVHVFVIAMVSRVYMHASLQGRGGG
jgi:hypothetical protein